MAFGLGAFEFPTSIFNIYGGIWFYLNISATNLYEGRDIPGCLLVHLYDNINKELMYKS